MEPICNGVGPGWTFHWCIDILSAVPILNREIRRRIARTLLGLLACTWLTAAAAPCFMDRSAQDQSMADMNCDQAADRVDCPAKDSHGCGSMVLDYRLSAQTASADTHATGALLALPFLATAIPQVIVQPRPAPARRDRFAARPPQRPLHLQLGRLLT